MAKMTPRTRSAISSLRFPLTVPDAVADQVHDLITVSSSEGSGNVTAPAALDLMMAAT
jgi:hypothetical protein